MYPIFERPIGDQLPVISFDDVERLRQLYGIPLFRSHLLQLKVLEKAGETSEGTLEATPSRGTSENAPEKCPQSIWAAAKGIHIDRLIILSLSSISSDQGRQRILQGSIVLGLQEWSHR